MAIDRLQAFEKEFDEQVKSLPLLKSLPVRAVLTYLHVVIDGLLNGSEPVSSQIRQMHRAAGEALVEKLSYLVPLLADSERNELGADAANVMNAVGDVDPDGQQLKTLIKYAQLSAIMPDVWRRNYVVESKDENAFVLLHPSEEYSKYEVVDIVMSELALSFVSSAPPAYNSRFDDLTGRVGQTDARFFGLAKTYTTHFLQNVVEPPIMSDDGYRAAAGVTRLEFERFRAALFGIAAACQGMGRAYGRRWRLHRHNQALRDEHLEWLSVNWSADFFQGLLMALSELSADAMDRLLPLFSVDFRGDELRLTHAADGYFPPIAWIRDAVFFNPALLQAFLPARNILYALNKLDVDQFNNVVSQHMEPELLRAAANVFQSLNDAIVEPNVKWASGDVAGEIDLLVYSPSENVALHVQAKAAIPPQGARMVKALESRIAEANGQLKRFHDLPQDVIDGIVGTATKLQVRDVRVVDVVLTRSCCGTYAIWKELAEVAVINLALLTAIRKKARLEKRQDVLGSFRELVTLEIERIVQAIKPAWVPKRLDCGAFCVTVPMLDYDRARMDRERERAALR